MALTYNYSQVANPDRWGAKKQQDDCTPDELKEWSKISYFAFLLMAIGQGEVSPANLKEVCIRAEIFQKLAGSVVQIGGEEYIYTVKDISGYLGYWTNVSDISRTVFLKTQVETVSREVALDLRNLVEVSA